jgi:hypothetical protein
MNRGVQSVLSSAAAVFLLASPLEAADKPPFTVARSAPSPRISGLFRRTDGWVGSDAAYSVWLGPQKSLWTFGDTWIGKIRGGRRIDCMMVNNSIALQSVGRTASQLDFRWGKKGGKPVAFFRPAADGTYNWPGDGATVDGKLYVFLHVIKPRPDNPAPFQFEAVEDLILKVENPLEDPARWHTRSVKIGNSAKAINFGVACLADAEYLYAYCSYPLSGKRLAGHPTVLARIDRRRLAALDMSGWQYWCNKGTAEHQGQWQRKLENPVILFQDGAPEMSVKRVAGIAGFIAAYMPPFSRTIFLRHAPAPQGPWSERIAAYQCPEKDPGILVYSAKAHPQLAPGKLRLALTYCRNSEQFARHFDRPEIYFPQGVEVVLARAPGSAREPVRQKRLKVPATGRSK